MKRNDRTTVTVLLSGGIDSSACVHYFLNLKFRVRPLFIAYGQPASKAELKSAKAVSAYYKLKLNVVSIQGLRIPKSGEIMGRNLVLFAAALMDMGLRTNLIALGIHRGTRYFDCSGNFAKICERLLEGYTDGRVRVGVPFIEMNKAQVWSYGQQSRVPLHLTWSCESGSKIPCGRCLSCKDKRSLLAST